MPRPITFLSDYGLADEFVGVVHAVIAHECPTARVIDLSHGVPRQSVLAGALMLARALPYAPPGVHLAVVDPEVGARRRAVALRTALDDRLLVGPDNGLLLPAADRFGWVTEAVEISTSSWRLEPVSATFHGRDLFAPVAARLAAGEALADAGTPLDPEELVRLELPEPRKGRKKGQLVAHAMVVDGFGNVQLDARPADLEEARLGHEVAVGNGHSARYLRTFADAEPGELLLYEDATGMLALAVNGGWADKELGGLRARRRGPPAPVVTALGRPRLHHREIDSTNRRARELASAGAPHGTLVTAGAQTAGRGRQGRRWEAPAGSALLCSLVLREFDALLSLRAGLAVADVAGEAARVKWPNDVQVDGPQGGRRAGRGPPARGLGGGRDRGQRVRGAGSAGRRGARARRRRGRAGGAARRARDPARASRRRRRCRRLRARDALLGAEVRWDGGEGVGGGDRRRRRPAGHDRRGRAGALRRRGPPGA